MILTHYLKYSKVHVENNSLVKVIGFCIFFLIATHIQAQKKVNVSLLNAYFEQARIDWEVPGLAIGIIYHDSIIMAQGYGFNEINSKEKVDASTIFPIASNSKSFTSASLAYLVDQGLIHWNDKVVDYLPYFKLYDPYVTHNMTIQDLLCHRSGLETFSGDLLWYCSNYSREEVIKRARYLEPVFGFRTEFGYSNIMFIAAGEVIPAVFNKSWDEFIQDHFFTPLGMLRSNTSVVDLEKFENVASPHTTFNGKVISIPFQNWDNVGGAGAINSCVNDMLKWLNLQLHQGTIDGAEYFSEASCWEMWSPQTIQSVSPGLVNRFPSMHFKAYGLGWGLNDYLGRKVISHSGGYDGMISYTCIVPEEQLGFVILTNKNSSLYYPLAYKILDEFLGAEGKDWSKEILEIVRKNEQRKVNDQEVEKSKKAIPPLPIEEYTGRYESQLYGEAELSWESGKMILKFIPSPLFIGELTYSQFNAFNIRMIKFPSLPEGTVNFYIGTDGKVEEMKIDIPNPDFDFTELKFIKI